MPQRNIDTARQPPGARYAERECDGCGIILPANQMTRTSRRVLAGVTKRRRFYSSTRGTFGSGGGTSERYRVEKVDLCPMCYDEMEDAARGTFFGKFLFYGGGIVAVALIYSFATNGTKPTISADSANAIASPTVNGSDDQPQTAATPMADASPADSASPTASVAAADSSSPDAGPATSPSPASLLPDQGQAETGMGFSGVDCSGTTSGFASIVCGSPALLKQDSSIMSIFSTLVSRALPGARSLLADEQRAWLAERSACGTADCLSASYQRRLGTVTSEAWTQYKSQHGTN